MGKLRGEANRRRVSYSKKGVGGIIGERENFEGGGEGKENV